MYHDGRVTLLKVSAGIHGMDMPFNHCIDTVTPAVCPQMAQKSYNTYYFDYCWCEVQCMGSPALLFCRKILA